MNKSHYFLSPVFVYEGLSLKLAMHRALVSRRGIYKAFEESEEMHQAFLEGQIYQVRIEGLDFSAQLVRESGPSGTHYNLHLIDGESAGGKSLQSLLGKVGFESPWRRGFARIPTVGGTTRTEVPAGALLTRPDGAVMSQVKNFSYHGLFLETRGTEDAVGQQIKFKLTTSKGLVLEEATGRVARIYDEILEPGKVKRGLGIRLLEMSDSARKIYYGMILDAFRELNGGS